MKTKTLVKSTKIIENCKDYSSFEDYKGVTNRVVNKARSAKLGNEEIGIVGFIGVIIVVLTRAYGGKLKKYIIDGQHRFEAVKMLSIPFSYQLIELHEDTKKNITRLITGLNSKNKNWCPLDYLNAYKGIYEYDVFAKHIETGKGGVGITDLQQIFLGGARKEYFNSGEMKFENEKKSLKTLEAVKTMLKVLPKNLDAKRQMYKAIECTGQSQELAKAIVEASRNGKTFTDSRQELFKEIMNAYNAHRAKPVKLRMVA